MGRRKILGWLLLFLFTLAGNAQQSYRNPVISGFNPDPSICRVGEDYYLVTSSFEYFPGVPVYHSRDLIHWKCIGYCLTRKSQLNLDNAWPSGGIFAPTLRYHKGTFYMITTNVSDRGNFYVTAKNPAGPWSEPVYVDKEFFDPSLFFDDDGTVYYHRRGDSGTVMAPIDIKTGKLLAPLKTVLRGIKCSDQEGPHLYKINGWYYLMVAEGGTRFGHMECIARSKHPMGPYEPSPYNPLIANHGNSADRVRSAGHGDLVQDHQGNWWMVHLATRHHTYDAMSHLGRETFLTPVEWKDGWPVLRDVSRAAIEVVTKTLPLVEVDNEPQQDDFSSPSLALCWNFLRNPAEGSWTLKERKNFLRLYGNANATNSYASVAFVGRRQQHMKCEVSTALEFSPSAKEEAGLTVWLNYRYHYDLGVVLRNGKPVVILRKTIGDITVEEVVMEEPSSRIELVVKAAPDKYEFYCTDHTHQLRYLGNALTRLLGTEIAGSFTGVYFAMYASGNGQPCKTPADFDWFEYKAEEK